MDSYISRTWGYRVLNEASIEIYHILLPQIELKSLAQKLSSFKEIVVQREGGIVVFVNDSGEIPGIVEKFKQIFQEIESKYATTPNFNYNIKLSDNRMLKEWFLALEGSIAVILATTFPQGFRNTNWELINSPIGGIFMEPYTIIFNQEYPKIIHPITLKNYEDRVKVEQIVALSVRGIINRIKEAQPGYEGLAMTSYVEGKTNLERSQIAAVINEKTRLVRTPKFSPLIRI